jgi:hypothetical protein
MIALVCLTAYCLLDLAVSTLVAIGWRTRAVAPANLPPTVRARRILLLRITPVAAAAAITLLIVAPAFALFEPAQNNEQFGPAIAALALIGLLHLLSGLARGGFSLWMTRRLERTWLASSSALDLSSGMRVFVVDDAPPNVALVGVFAPQLIAARSVIDRCTPAEIMSIVAHERGHFAARDNFKRWLMASLPGALRHTQIHREMVDAWHEAAEDGADDAATQGDAEARADLAALLLKVIRVTPQSIRKIAVVSPFVERDGLERRVRRLLQPELEPPAKFALVPMIALAATVALGIATLLTPAMLNAVFEVFETLVAFGR